MKTIRFLIFLVVFNQVSSDQKYLVYDNPYQRKSPAGFHSISRKEDEARHNICGKSQVDEGDDEEEDEEKEAVEGSGDASRPKRSTGGQLAELGQFPWAGVLVRRRDNHRMCSLSIISKRHALTAAHCMVSSAYDKISDNFINGNVAVGYGGNCHYGSNVFKGDECTENNVQLKNVSAVSILSSYMAHAGPGIAMDDIALIELATDIQEIEFSPVCLPQLNSVLPSFGTLAGFGRTGRDKYYAQMRYYTGALSYNVTKKFLDFRPRLFSNQEAAEEHGVEITKKANWKKGDSGSGVFGWRGDKEQAIQVGVIHGGFPGRATLADVRKYVQWICTLTGVCRNH